MHVAILGAGFCGMATAWHLLRRGGCQVTVYDPLDIGTGTSGIAAGMLHPFVGAHAKLNWRSREGLAATTSLLQVAQQALGDEPVIVGKGMLRLALTEKQAADFSACAALHSDVRWLTAAECQDLAPHLAPVPGILVESALAIDCEKYLKGLWLACEKMGGIFKKQAIQTLAELDQADRIVVAMGAAANTLPELAHLKLKTIKGQVLELAWPEGLDMPKMTLSSQTYLVTNRHARTCIAGATYEKQFATAAADLETAAKEIIPKTAAYMPAIAQAKILGCRAGRRCVTPDRRPLLAPVNDRCWVLTGMGSKGLLYHAMLAEELIKQLFE